MPIPKNDTTSTEELPQKKFYSLTYISPTANPAGNLLKTEKHCWVFHCHHFDRMVEMLNASSFEKDKSRSMSIVSRKPTRVRKPTLRAFKSEFVIKEINERDRDGKYGFNPILDIREQNDSL